MARRVCQALAAWRSREEYRSRGFSGRRRVCRGREPGAYGGRTRAGRATVRRVLLTGGWNRVTQEMRGVR
jgi:hypothetical protein